MKNIAPGIKRQRLLIEGFYTDIEINEQVIRDFFPELLLQALNLRK